MSDELDEKLESKKEDEKLEEKKEASKEATKDVKKDVSAEVEALKKTLEAELREKVRTEEKAKLYDSFEKYKQDAKEAEDAKVEAEKRLKEYETKNLTIDEQTALKLTELEKSNELLTSKLQEVIETANSSITTLQLELSKKEILAKYGEEIIPALVSGSTIEEIEASAEKAHNEYLAISEKALTKLKDTAKQKEPIGTGIGPSSQNIGTNPTIAEIKNITDPKEWEKLKLKLLKEIQP